MNLPKLTPAPPDKIKSFFQPVFWGAADEGLVGGLMKLASERVRNGSHFSDNLFCWARNNSMLDDGPFVEAWQSNTENPADIAIVWRRYILATAAYHCVQLEGDFVECGAYTGVGVKTIVDYLGGKEFPRRFWAYDLFEHNAGMAHHSMPKHHATLHADVVAKFKDYPQVEIVKGAIPESFAGRSPEKISYLHIDLNGAAAELAALEALFPRVVPGGMIILDDYEWVFYRAQKLVQDPWFEARGYRVMPLPTGQGLVMKR